MKRSLLGIFLVIAIALVGQDVSSRLIVRIDLTSKKLYSLSEKTLKILKELDGAALSATAFVDEDEYGRDEAERLFTRYSAEYRRMSFRFVSPVKNPGLVAEYGVGSHGTVVWEYRGHRAKTTGLSEEEFTNGILKLIRPHRPVLYITTGHGEKSQDRELAAISRIMNEENYELRELLIQREGGIPEDADCLLIPGPKRPFLAEEIERIDRYFRNGGRVLLLLDPYADGGFRELLGSYGIGLTDDAVVDKGSKMFGGDELFPMAVEYSSHSITRSMDGICMFPVARSLAVRPYGGGEFEARPLAKTSDKAWAETDRESLAAGTAANDSAEDRAGPLVLAASVEYKADTPEKDGALVVVGDSDFIANAYVSIAGNGDFFLRSLAWLAGPGELIAIRAREPGHHPIVLSRNQGRILGWMVLGILPGLLVFLGVLAWWKRRKAP